MSGFKKSGGFGGNRNKHGFGGGDRPNFGHDRGFRRQSGQDDGQRVQLFSAVCDECHKPCEVPFRPTGERPVYCRECFAGKRGSSDGGHQRKDAAPRNYPNREFSSPLSNKPQAEDKRIEEIKRQLDAVNSKVDRLLHMMEKDSAAKPVPAVAYQAEKKAEVSQALTAAPAKPKALQAAQAKPASLPKKQPKTAIAGAKKKK